MNTGKWTSFFAFLTWLPVLLTAATFTVTNTKDDANPGSLRWAILQVNLNAGPDEIVFSLPTADAGFNGQYWTIKPVSPLPDIGDTATVINGKTQTWNVGNTNPNGPEILLDGSSAGSSTAGLQLRGANNSISGLCICGFSQCGIHLTGSGAHDNRIDFCYVGIAPDGVTAMPNHIGIILSYGASQNYIGSPGDSDWNIISGNETYGVEIYQAHGNSILNNRIGTNGAGTAAVGNAWAGVWIAGASTNNDIGAWVENAGNLISGNGMYGILISEEGSRINTVEHNLIGTDVQGLDRIANETAGICINEMARANIIGGRNIISGNAYGLIINGVGTDSNRVSGNWIGLDATGTDTLPNYLHGLRIEDGARYNIIGGAGEGFGNIISGSGWSGMCTVGDSTAYNTYAFNWCGLDTSGTKDLGNNFYGAHFGGKANRFLNNYFCGNRCGVMMSGYSEKCVLQENVIGLAPDGSTVIPNDEGGVRLQDIAYRDTLRFNQVVGNTGWGVELKGIHARKNTLSQNGITLNEMGGILLTDGANEDISKPLIDQIDLGAGRIRGYSSPLNIIEFFEDAGNQGETFLGQTTADANGNWEWEGIFSGPNITATSTDQEGNTSTFSEPFVVMTEVPDQPFSVSDHFVLHPNFPNPFNPTTRIGYSLASWAKVRIAVYNMRGQRIRTLIDAGQDAGEYNVVWKGNSENGTPVGSGVYLVRMEARNFIASQKIILIK